jgi:hypothetical protein
VIRAAWLIRLIACDVEDFALDCDVAETAVHSYIQLSVSIPAGRGAGADLCIARELLWR